MPESEFCRESATLILMLVLRRSHRTMAHLLLAGLSGLLAAGCASPGPPRPPSLYIPEPAQHIAASRTGSTVEVRFIVPVRTTDGLPIKASTLSGSLCREAERAACVAVGTKMRVALKAQDGSPNLVVWHDTLPENLASGPSRQLAYRVELYNESGHSGGLSDAAFVAAGAAPLTVEGLSAEGSRAGIVLRWKANPAATGDVLLRREDLRPDLPAEHHHKKDPVDDSEPGVVWLVAAAPDRTLDASALPDVPYRYTAVRRTDVQVGGRSLELRSAVSTPAEHTLREIYPPAVPTGLTAAGYRSAANGSQPAQFAVDLIWQPVNDAKLAGYNVYRQVTSDNIGMQPEKLNKEPVLQPAYRDTTANPRYHYRYSISAVDAKGNESKLDFTELAPSVESTPQ